MNHIDRLIIKAELATGNKQWYLFLCTVENDPETGMHILKPQLWNGKPGEARALPETVHACEASVEEGIAEIRRQYPSQKDPLIIWVDWGKYEDV